MSIQGRILKTLEGGLGFILTVLSLDLLYLYYTGVWIEPNQIILWAELVSLYLFSVTGIIYFVVKVRRSRRK